MGTRDPGGGVDAARRVRGAPATGYGGRLGAAGAGSLGPGRAGGERRLLLCVDDGHLLDDASAALVHQLVAAGEAFALVAVRRGEPTSDALQALWKDELCELMALGDLDRGEVEGLLAAALGAPLDGRGLDETWQRTLGNPMFLRELVLHGIDRGALADDGGIWRWRGELGPGMRLAELVGARLEGLDDPTVATLELVAVGAPLEVDLLDPGELDALATLEQRGLAERRADGRRRVVDLAHPLYGDVVRARTSRTRTEAIQRRLGGRRGGARSASAR